MARELRPTQRKVLLLLFGGIALGLSGSPRQYFRILKAIGREWKEIDNGNLKRTVVSLYRKKLVEERYNRDGSITLVLTDKGKRKALTYNLEEMEIPRPPKWDGKWRIVAYDIPERLRIIRKSLNLHLRQLGFFELQRSVFVHPYECSEQITFLTEFYRANRFVRFITATSIDNEACLKKKFGIK